MTVQFALAYIPLRMRELGYQDQYTVRWRHVLLDVNETKTIVANNELYLLIEPSSHITVKSRFGIYDMSVDNITELQYEHRGHIDIRNNLPTTQWVLFIQVIPRHRPKKQ